MLGQQNGQLILGYWNHTILRAVDDRDGCTPVALSTDQPVTQAIRNHKPTYALILDKAGYSGNCLFGCHAIERTRVDHHPKMLFRLCPGRGIARLFTCRSNNLAYGNPELTRKLKVALIMRRH